MLFRSPEQILKILQELLPTTQVVTPRTCEEYSTCPAPRCHETLQLLFGLKCYLRENQARLDQLSLKLDVFKKEPKLSSTTITPTPTLTPKPFLKGEFIRQSGMSPSPPLQDERVYFHRQASTNSLKSSIQKLSDLKWPLKHENGQSYQKDMNHSSGSDESYGNTEPSSDHVHSNASTSHLRVEIPSMMPSTRPNPTALTYQTSWSNLGTVASRPPLNNYEYSHQRYNARPPEPSTQVGPVWPYGWSPSLTTRVPTAIGATATGATATGMNYHANAFAQTLPLPFSGCSFNQCGYRY